MDRDTFAPLEETAERWTDYMGSTPISDFDFRPWMKAEQRVAQTRSYLGTMGHQAIGGGDPVAYYHGDLVGSTTLTTDEGGDAAGQLAYTAFGEPIGNPASLDSRQ